jgi:hypothetical protein
LDFSIPIQGLSGGRFLLMIRDPKTLLQRFFDIHPDSPALLNGSAMAEIVWQRYEADHEAVY